MLCAAAAAQSTETVLYSFGAYPNDGAFPDGGLLVDQSGNIYGVTNGGGAYCENDGGCGTVYELSPALGGGWTETVLHNFCSTGISFTCPDGAIPYAGLVEDEAGNLYGTTSLGGTGKYGIVYRLSPPAEPGGSWTQTTLWNFSGGAHNGFEPGLGKLNIDKSGNIYGTTTEGGSKNFGVVFELSPNAQGSYSFSLLHSFSGPDGAYPQYGVALDAAGNLYGTTERGGVKSSACFVTNPPANTCGVVYELSPSNGTWTETVLHRFNGITGFYPITPISFDASGNLYGTFAGGGEGSGCFYLTCGGVFKLVPGSDFKFYSFDFDGVKGNGTPESGVLVVGPNELYGSGGQPLSPGNVYRLTGGRQSILYSFCSLPGCADGSAPVNGTIVSRNGLLYGATYEGGANGVGVVYSLTK
jgi:uncharacterized repeat protein (TIGR03803 family)